jgi:protein-disulfide isomerase
MASRKEQKDQACAARLAAEREAAARSRKNRQMQLLGIVGVAIVAVAILAVVSASGGGSSTSANPSTPQSKAIVAGVDKLLSGIPQSGTTLGKPSAPVTLTYYGDLECPVCRDFTLTGGFPQLVSNDVRSGKVKVVYKSFCTATCNDHSPQLFDTQQVAAYAAGKQSLFWNYAELFYHEQGSETSSYVNESYLTGLAKQTSELNVSKWHTDRGDPTLLAQVQADGTAGTAAGVQGTPTLIVSGPKGTQPVASSLPSYSQLEQAISQAS